MVVVIAYVVAAVAAFLFGWFNRKGTVALSPLAAGLLVGAVAAAYFTLSAVFLDEPATLGLAVQGVVFGLIIFVAPLLGYEARRRTARQKV